VDLLGPLPPTEAKDEEAGADHLAMGSMTAAEKRATPRLQIVASPFDERLLLIDAWCR
jgi:hypothetical protein